MINSWIFWIVIGYGVVMNGIVYLMMRRDKMLARHHKRRIPEKCLLTLGLLGGGIGGWLGMKHYHHKTLHASFRWCYGMNSLLWGVVLVTFLMRGIR